MPTKHTSSLVTQRAAATVMSSSGEQFTLRDSRHALGKRLGPRPAQLFVDPPEKTGAIARNRIPCEIEGVVPGVIPVCVGWKCSAGHDRDGADRPPRQNARIGRR